MECVPSHDLGSFPHWRKPDDHFLGTRKDTERILRDAARALTHIHAQGIQHKDIRPANILYSAERGAAVCDFGLAEPVGSDQLRYTGAPWYISPELIRGDPRDAPADMWALGVVALYLLGLTILPEMDDRTRMWMTSDLVSRDAEHRSRATISQNHWMGIVAALREELSPSDPLHVLVRGMLETEPQRRLSAEEVAAAAEKIVLSLDLGLDYTARPLSPESSSSGNSSDRTDPLSPWVYEQVLSQQMRSPPEDEPGRPNA